MRRASLVFYLGVLLASLALAYFTWVAEPKSSGDGIPAFRCKKGDLVRLTYAAGDRTVTFSKKKSRYSEEASWWIEAVPFSGASAAETVEAAGGDVPGEVTAGAPGDGADGPAAERSDVQEEDSSEETAGIVVFKANERLQESLDKFCPWLVFRSLGIPGAEKREEFGLTESAETLILEQPSGPRTFRVGGTTFGPRDRYVADAETGDVFLAGGQDLRDLLRPEVRFMERALHAFKAEDVARIKVRARAREKELIREGSESGRDHGWADSRSPGETQDLYRNWIRRLFALRPTEYVRPTTGEEAGGCVAPAGSTQELNVTFHGPVREMGFLTLYRERAEKEDTAYFACSEHTEILVKVPRTQAETLLKDLEDLLPD